MKGSLRNMEYIYIYLMLFCCLYIKECMCVINIDQDRCGFPGGSVSLSCTLPALEFTQPFAWSNDIFGGDISVCSTGGCGAPANSRYSATANTTGIYFTITGLTRADDEATWTCTMQGGGSLQPKSLDLTVGDYPTTCAISKNSDGSFKCETDCGYPTSDLTIDWFLNTTSTVVDLSNPSISIDTTSTPVCSSGGKASTTLPASNINKDGDLYCKCGMQTVCPEKALIVSGSEAVTGTPTPTPTPMPTPATTNGTNVTRQCSCSWLPCGWKCYYLYIIAGVVSLVLLIVGVCCCYRHGYFGKKKEENRKESYENKVYDKNISGNGKGQPTDSSRHRERTAM